MSENNKTDYEKVVEQWSNAIGGQHGYNQINGRGGQFPMNLVDRNTGRTLAVGSDEYKAEIERIKRAKGLI